MRVLILILASGLAAGAPVYKQWEYSWFWGFDSFIPAGMNDPDSNVPKDFFPQAKCALGAPAGAYVKGAKSTYTRSFAHADVFVDLRNRTNSKVTFKGCKYT